MPLRAHEPDECRNLFHSVIDNPAETAVVCNEIRKLVVEVRNAVRRSHRQSVARPHQRDDFGDRCLDGPDLGVDIVETADEDKAVSMKVIDLCLGKLFAHERFPGLLRGCLADRRRPGQDRPRSIDTTRCSSSSVMSW